MSYNNRVKQGESFKISNNSFGYQDPYKHLNQYLIMPLIVFETTCVYSAFLEDHNVNYLKLNPLKVKKLMDNNCVTIKSISLRLIGWHWFNSMLYRNCMILNLENITNYKTQVVTMKNLLTIWLSPRINCTVIFSLPSANWTNNDSSIWKNLLDYC